MTVLFGTLIGVLFTIAIFYTKYCYGTGVVLMVIIVFIGAFALALLFITEIMGSVCKDASEDEDIADKRAYKINPYNSIRKQLKYRMLSLSANAISKIVNFCTEEIEDEEASGDQDE